MCVFIFNPRLSSGGNDQLIVCRSVSRLLFRVQRSVHFYSLRNALPLAATVCFIGRTCTRRIRPRVQLISTGWLNVTLRPVAEIEIKTGK